MAGRIVIAMQRDWIVYVVTFACIFSQEFNASGRCQIVTRMNVHVYMPCSGVWSAEWL